MKQKLVKTSHLRRIINILMDHLEEQGIHDILVENDYYWYLGEKELFDVYKEPSDLSIGQISEDLEILEKIRLGKLDPLGYNLVTLTTLLRAIGEKYSS